MAQGFNADLKCQQEWGWLLAIWLLLSGSAAGLYLVYTLYRLPLFFGLLAIVTMLFGAAVLLLEQGSPQRAWRAIFRPGTSWLSRGVLFVTGFLLTSLLAIAPGLVAGWPWSDGGLAARALGWIAALCALMIVLYPGLFLANNRSIPFWHTPLLPLALISYAAVGAGALVLLGAPFLRQGAQPFINLAALLILVNGVVVAVYLLAMQRAGGPARAAVRLLHSTPLRWTFQIGVVAVGMLLPLGLLAWSPSTAQLAGAGMLVGGLLFRYSVLRAGVYVPPALVQEGIDFSRLNRSGTEFEREYAGMAGQHGGGRG